MIYHKYKNITFEISTTDDRWVAFLGYTTMDFSKEIVVSALEEDCLVFEQLHRNDKIKHEWNFNGDDSDVEEVAAWLREKEIGALHEEYDTDLQLALINWMLEQDEKFTIPVSTQHISWLLHDLTHVKQDMGGCTIYVGADAERHAIMTSFEQALEQYPDHLPPFDMLEELESAFHERFNERLNLGDVRMAYFAEEDIY